MSYCSTIPILLAATLSVTAGFLVAEQNGQRITLPVIRQVDHILIESDDPGVLFEFLTRTLELPVAWPLMDYPGFTSGGAAAGNVNIEILKYAAPRSSAARRRLAARFVGIALEPLPLSDSLPELRARGIPYHSPEAFLSTLPDGSRGTSWTTVSLTQLSKPELSVFLREYSPAFLNVAIRRNQLGGQLVLNQGGPLGIESVDEILLGTKDFQGARARWQQLLAPIVPSSKGIWQIGEGPAIHLVGDGKDRIRRIVLKVESLERAKAFLKEKRMLGPASAAEIALHPSAIQGLDIRIR